MLTSILAPVFVFAVIVIIHEGGHFIMAKLTGMKVEEFAVGFGPKLASFVKGETTYSLRAIPLGGYNKIVGMDQEDSDDPRAFSQRPVWARLLVISAGSLFNILLAFFIFAGIFWLTGIHIFKDVPVVGSVIEGSSAYHTGMAAEDRILSINGNKVEKWEDIGRLVSDQSGRVVFLTIESHGQTKTVTVIPQDNGEGRGIIGITPYVETQDVSLGHALSLSVERCAFILKMIFGGLAGMLSGGAADVAGPIGVARMAGAVADSGMLALFSFIALLSLNLGFLNLLPVPLLDGGLLVLTIIEGILGRELPENALRYIQAAGITVIGFLFLLAMFNDITALLK